MLFLKVFCQQQETFLKRSSLRNLIFLCRFAEIMVVICFIMLVLLWFLREPKFMPGWGELFKKGYSIIIFNYESQTTF